MSDLKADQALIWAMFQNLRNDAADFSATDVEPTNLAQELLTGLLNNQTFRDTITSVATTIQREDIAAEINDTAIGESPRDEMANILVTAAVKGNAAPLVDLAKRPDTPILSLEQLEKFWNVDAFISNDDPHIHTHIQADTRYVSFFDQYVAAKEMSGELVTDLREEVVSAHETASATLDEIEFDRFQMDNYGAASGFYDAIETGNLDVLGYDELPEQNIFNGLTVATPIDIAELTEVTAPLPHIAIQAEKNNAALEKDFNQDANPKPALSPDTESELETAQKKTPELEPELEPTIHLVQNGDNLWNIAKNEYGLSSYKDIMRAVDHIAVANGLEQGTDANWIQIGQSINMPTAEQIAQPINALDWNALSSDPKLGGQNPPAVN